jgi:sulfate-transporting ATPase
VVLMAALLTLGYRFTRFGLLTRATAESQTGAYVSGTSPDRVALLNWMLSAVIAGVAGILIAPISPLTPVTYTLFVVPALAAAVVGRFERLMPIAAAGIAIGMLQSEATKLATRHDWLPTSGLPELVPLIVIFGALLIVGGGMPIRGGLVRQPLGRAPQPRSLLVPALAGTAVGVLALVVTTGTWRAAVIGTLISAIIGLSFVVVTGYAGQVSLAQLALAGTAAFSLSGLTHGWDIPFPLAPLLAALVATVIGVVVGLPALRLRGLTLGVVTLALAYAIESVWFRNSDFVSSSGARVTPPELFGTDLGIGAGKAFPRIEFGLLCLVTLVLVALGVAVLRRSSLGSAMLAVRANERSAAAAGVNVVRVKVLSFALASFIAGLGGSLLGYRQGVVTFGSFTAIGGLALLGTAYLAGVTSVWGGINAGILSATGITFIALDRWIDLGQWFNVITGVLLVVTLIAHPEGVASIGHGIADRVRARLPLGAAGTSPPATAERRPVLAAASPPGAGEPAGTAALTVQGLGVRYGGVIAVHDVSLRVEPGGIVGLIGPNGAGKTSVIDAVTGFAAATGTVLLGGRPIDHLNPHRRVRAGLARTFQSLELYDDLSVEENVRVAAYGGRRSARGSAVTRALEQVGIGELRDRPAGDLSQGERQLVSIARACVAEPRVVLLDEPAAGLDTNESRWLGERIRDIAAGGTGVLLVDHDVALVLGICDLVYVLDFGAVIAEGPPAAVRANQAVAAAYLGVMHDAVEVTA